MVYMHLPIQHINVLSLTGVRDINSLPDIVFGEIFKYLHLRDLHRVCLAGTDGMIEEATRIISK